jgi:type I restriction enzyme M protein
MVRQPNRTKPFSSTATIGFEAKLWLAADKLRNNMDAAEYKHVVLGLIFLKYISDTAGKCRSANSEVRTRNARPIRHSKFIIRKFPLSHLQASAKQPTVGMSNAEVRMPNRSRFASLRHLKFANRNSHE